MLAATGGLVEVRGPALAPVNRFPRSGELAWIGRISASFAFADGRIDGFQAHLIARHVDRSRLEKVECLLQARFDRIQVQERGLFTLPFGQRCIGRRRRLLP